GLAPLARVHGGISEDLALVATFPQLEYPRQWPASVHVVGPLAWELPCEDIELPGGDAPLVLVAPSTVHDPDLRLVRATLRALAGGLAAWSAGHDSAGRAAELVEAFAAGARAPAAA